LRDGNWVVKDAGHIVPGDIFAVGLGDLVPADAKIVSGKISVDQSTLTGESLPVSVSKSDVIFSSSIVVRGEAECVAVNTATNTYFGKTAQLVRIAKPKSHQEEIMLAVIRYMMYVGIVALVLVSIDALLQNIGVLSVLTFAVIFLIGAVPVALPAVLTIVQAVGAMELSKKSVLVTRLDSIEDAASMDVLCLDKTGTITQNRLSVIELVPFFGYAEEDVAVTAGVASSKEGNDPIDLAVVENAKTAGVDLADYKQVCFTPFDPSTKKAESLVQFRGHRFKAVKGAPQIVTSICQGLSANDRQQLNEEVEDLSQKGYRTLAVARSEGDDLRNFKFVGLISLADPIRPDSKEMIEEARRLGVKPIMLTGDNINIAKEISGQASIGDRIITMTELKGMTESEQTKIVEENEGFAEIYPEDKHKIVRLLQLSGHVVGMTGDGVNDAPALKQAEMGIAVNNSTDVAKASASMVLTEEGVGVIIDAIKTSRKIYQRMLSWVINKVTKVIQFIVLLTLGFFWLQDVTISLLGMVLLVFANDFVTMSLATDNVKHTSNPNKWNVRNITLASLPIGLLLVVEGALAILIGINYFHLGLERLKTLVMLTLIFTSQFRVLIVRERSHFWNSRPGRGLLVSTISAIIAFALLGLFGVIVPSLSVGQILFTLVFSGLFTLVLDFPKCYVFRKVGL
jgi:H+-transporting ATPase